MAHIYVLQAVTPISHGDPGANAIGNATPFRTEQVLFPRPGSAKGPRVDPDTGEIDDIKAASIFEAESAIRRLAEQFPIAVDSPVYPALQELSGEEFVAGAFLFTLVSELNKQNGGEGAGLFGGMERYNMLLSRVRTAATSIANSLPQVYSRILTGLDISTTLPGITDILPFFFALPRAVQMGVIKCLAEDTHALLEGVARPWFELERKQRGGKEKGTMFRSEERPYDPTGRVMGYSLDVAEGTVPVISAGSFRHEIRTTLFEHLLETTGLGSIENVTTNNLLPPWVSMLFSNGGNVEGGKSAPTGSASLNYTIAQLFPMIDLLGGCVPTHILSRGKLSASSHTLCAQTATSTARFGYTSDVDASSLLQTITNTRHTPDGMDHSKDSGMMIFSFTALKAGAQLLFKINFAPFTPDLTRGAAYFAVNKWLTEGGFIGGRAASGCGQLQLIDEAVTPDRYENDDPDHLAEQYAAYIEENKDKLRQELTTGFLGWKTRVA